MSLNNDFIRRLHKRILKRIFNSLQKAHNHWRHIRTTRKISLFDSTAKSISEELGKLEGFNEQELNSIYVG